MSGLERSLVFLALALLAEVAGTVGGFGSSVFFVPIANLFFAFEAVLGITALFHLASNLSKLGMFRGGIDRGLVLRIGVPSILFAVGGAYATAHVPTRGLEVALAVFLIGFSGWMLMHPEWSARPTASNAVLGGAVSGGMAGLVGTGGAIRGLTLAAFALPKEVFVATSAGIDLGIDLSRSIVYYRNGYMRGLELAWIPALVMVAVVGTWLGRGLLRHVPQQRFRQLALAMVAGIGMLTLYSAIRG
ncbi:sulfite exporter TauE/SafE family protein [Luteimonas vadosa]|uniref:Probable membrane transporter protein n=1 Tax=Luteimonas vadosa TaxID=1165507 RepID=A0ABP9DZU5_9GAMM